MKVLWLSNCKLTTGLSSDSGTWLQTMAQSLVSSGIELFNITQGYTKSIEIIEEDNIKQWIFPRITLKDTESQKLQEKIKSIVQSIQPDIIHIWGMELCWGLLTIQGCFDGYKTLLEIQGIKGACAEVFMGGMTKSEVYSTIGLREILFPSHSLYGFKKNHEKWFPYEKEMLRKHNYISTQSDWVRAWIAPYISRKTQIFETAISVRNEFLELPQWEFHNREKKMILCFADDGKPYKGLDVAIKALRLVVKTIPNVTLNIVGNFKYNRSRIKMPGYCRYILKLISDYGLKNNVNFLGLLNAKELAERMADSDVMLHPSFVESYSLALAESMVIGVPSVISFAGAMPELASNEENALFYNSYDFRKCAFSLVRLLGDEELSMRLSNKARSVAWKRNVPQRVVNIQLNIYKDIIEHD